MKTIRKVVVQRRLQQTITWKCTSNTGKSSNLRNTGCGSNKSGAAEIIPAFQHALGNS